METAQIEMLRRRSAYWADYGKAAQAEVSTLSRWLNASLLAINGAASLAVASAAQKIDGLRPAGLLFFGGIVAAMFAAWFNQFLTDRFISPAANFAEYFADSVVKRELDPEREESLNATVRKLRGWSWVGPAAGFISFILAAIGACDLANTLDESSADKISICRPLERDMLTSSATHGESMERFKALGCGS